MKLLFAVLIGLFAVIILGLLVAWWLTRETEADRIFREEKGKV